MMRRMVPNRSPVVFFFFFFWVWWMIPGVFGWCAFPASQLIINDAGGFLFFFSDLFSFGFLHSILLPPVDI